MDSLLFRAMYTGLLTGIVIAIPMGPAGLESVRWTLTRGLKKGILVAAGSLIADAIDILFINFGLLDLLETNKLLEALFWIISGFVIIFIGYTAIKSNKSPEHVRKSDENKKSDSRPVFVGFIVNFFNPMTHFFWLTLSSTAIRVWRTAGRLPYFLFAVFMLCGMFMSLTGLNVLVSRGKKIAMPKLSGKAAGYLAYGIAAIGVGFVVYGTYKLIVLLT